MNAQELFDAFRDTDQAFLADADQLADRTAEQASCTADTQPENEIQQIFAQYSDSKAKAPTYHLEEHETAAKTDVFADLTGSDASLPVRRSIASPEERRSTGRIFSRICGIAAAVAIFCIGAFAVSVVLSRNGGMSVVPATQPSDPDTQVDVPLTNQLYNGTFSEGEYNLKIRGVDHTGNDLSYVTEVDNYGNISYCFMLDEQEFDLKSGDDFQLYRNESGKTVQIFDYTKVPNISMSYLGNMLYEDLGQFITISHPEEKTIELKLEPTVQPSMLERDAQMEFDKAIETGDMDTIDRILTGISLKEATIDKAPAIITQTEAGIYYKVCVYQDGKILDIIDPDTGETGKYYQYELTENAPSNIKTISFMPNPTTEKKNGSKVEVHAIGMLPNGRSVNHNNVTFRLKTTAPGTQPHFSSEIGQNSERGITLNP